MLALFAADREFLERKQQNKATGCSSTAGLERGWQWPLELL